MENGFSCFYSIEIIQLFISFNTASAVFDLYYVLGISTYLGPQSKIIDINWEKRIHPGIDPGGYKGSMTIFYR